MAQYYIFTKYQFGHMPTTMIKCRTYAAGRIFNSRLKPLLKTLFWVDGVSYSSGSVINPVDRSAVHLSKHLALSITSYS